MALALMIAAGVMAFSKYSQDNAIQEELNGQVQEAQRLYSSEAFPSDENIAEAKKQQAQLKEFRVKLKEVFTPAPKFPKMGDQEFKNYLMSGITELTTMASQANVALPSPFSFTFTPHRTQFQFPSNCIESWLVQLADIKVVCEILYASRVNALDSIQRVPISPDIDRETSEILGGNISTNKAGVTFTPYLISFRSFSGELAAVLEGFSRSKNCIIVKTVNVVPSTIPLPISSVSVPTAAPARRMMIPAPTATPRVTSLPAEMEARYGIGGKSGSIIAAPISSSPVLTRSAQLGSTTVTILKDQPVQATILLEIIRLGHSQ